MHNKRKWEETGVNVCDGSVANGLNKKTPQNRSCGLKSSDRGLWMIEWNWSSLRDRESALAKNMILDFFMSAWKKQAYCLTHLWYGVAYQVRDKWTLALNAQIYPEVLDSLRFYW